MINKIGSTIHSWSERGRKNTYDPLAVDFCGYQKFITRNHEITRKNGRDDYQVIYVLKGKGYFTIDGKVKEIEEGNVVFYPPNVPQIFEYKCSDSTEVYWAHFSGYAIEDYIKGFFLKNSLVNFIDIDNEIVELFEKVINELQTKNPMYQKIVSAYFLEIISKIERDIKKKNCEKNEYCDDQFNKIISYIHTNYKNDYKVEDYAKKFNLSDYYFMHKFKRNTGMTLVEYITRIRINEAKYILANSSLTIKEVSSIIGYNNPFYFSRVFKKMTDKSPTEYRKESN